MGLLVMVLDKRVQIQKMDTIGHQNPNLFLNEKDGLFILVYVITVVKSLTAFWMT